MDARPSDCLALAVRVKCPIYIDEAVVDEAGISVKMVEEKNRELKTLDTGPQAPGGAETRRCPILRPCRRRPRWQASGRLLDAAIEEENYEEAAQLRDRIRELESP